MIWVYNCNGHWILQKGSSAFANPLKFSCYLVMDPSNCMSVKAALRYWGCAIQAGAHVAGAFYPASALNEASNKASIEEKFCPLATAGVPLLSMDSAINWDIAMNNMDEDAKKLLTINNISSRSISPVTFDQNKKMLTLFMPGFDKSEIKLSQVGFLSYLLQIYIYIRLYKHFGILKK